MTERTHHHHCYIRLSSYSAVAPTIVLSDHDCSIQTCPNAEKFQEPSRRLDSNNKRQANSPSDIDHQDGHPTHRVPNFCRVNQNDSSSRLKIAANKPTCNSYFSWIKKWIVRVPSVVTVFLAVSTLKYYTTTSPR